MINSKYLLIFLATQPENYINYYIYILSVYVRSDVNRGNRNHVRHTIVQAEIVKRNIPVSNGVVHLIGKPLVKTASNLWGFLKQEVIPI